VLWPLMTALPITNAILAAAKSHSARGTPTDQRSRVPSLEPFRRRLMALAATLVIGPASETLHNGGHMHPIM
jgi:hypothetical protein